MNSDIEAVKSRINIVDIVGEKVRLKKSGPNYFGLCPFHTEKSPSFSVNETIQIYKCFGCGESGDAISFLQKTENLTFPEALENLADRVGYKLNSKFKSQNTKDDEEIKKLYEVNKVVSEFYQKKLFDGENDGKAYAKKRNLTKELVKDFGIGYATGAQTELLQFLKKQDFKETDLKKYGLIVEKEDKRIIDKFRNRLIFTIYDEKGRVVGFSGRNIAPERPNIKPPKYLNSPETLVFKKSQLLFGLYQGQNEIRKLKFAILSEGQMNIISSHRVGVKNIVASLGTSFTDLHLKLLSRYADNIYLAFDKDTAGKKAMIRTLEMIFKKDMEVKIVHWDSKFGKDPDELISANEKLWIDAINHPIDPIESIFNDFEDKFGTEDLDKVSSFLRIILPLINSHKNEVKKEFYLKYLAGKFDVSVGALNGLMTRDQPKVVPQVVKKINDDKQIEKVEINIFDKIFALLVQNWSTMRHLTLALERDFIIDKYKELHDCLSMFTDIEDISQIRENLDPELSKCLDDAMLLTILHDQNVAIEEHISKLMKISRNEYKKMMILEWKKNPDDPQIFEAMNRLLNTK